MGSIRHLDLEHPGAGWKAATPGSPEFWALFKLVDPKILGEQTVLTATRAILYAPSGPGG